METDYTKFEDNEAIDHFCKMLGFKPVQMPTDKIGNYAVVDPGTKSIDGVVDKIWRKFAEEGLPEDTIDSKDQNPFDVVSDYARCSILLPSYHDLPNLLVNFYQQTGGEISYHDRPDYKAVHIHSQLNGINCEYQFHTYETYALKKATDFHYHKWRTQKAKHKEEVLANPDYQAEQAYMKPMCNQIYKDSGFYDVLGVVKEIQDAFNRPIPPMEDREFVLILRKAMATQPRLLDLAKGQLTILQRAERNQSQVKGNDGNEM